MIFLIVKIVWGHHKFPTQINDLYLCKKYLYTWKKNIHKSKKKIYKIALIKVIYCNTQRHQWVFYKNIDTQTKKYTKANIYDIAMDSGAMSKCVSFTIIGIDYKSKNLRLRSYGLRQGVWISWFVGYLGGHNRPHQILMYWCELHLFTLTFTFCFEQKSGGT